MIVSGTVVFGSGSNCALTPFNPLAPIIFTSFSMHRKHASLDLMQQGM